MAKAKEITVEIVKHIATIEEFGSGYTREFNLVSWNGKAPKYDIRNWSADHTKMSSGLTMFPYEMDAVLEAYNSFKDEYIETVEEYKQKKKEE